MQPMRIALFTETFLPKIDGIVTILKLTLDHLRADGHEAVVFAAGERVTSYAGYPVVSMRGLPAPMYPELELALPNASHFEQLRAFSPDVVHVLNPAVSGLAGMYYARRLDVPLLVSFHTHLMEMARFYGYGAFEDLLWALHRMVYNRADRVLATSERIVGELTAHGIRDVGLWRRGVDTARFSPAFASDDMRDYLTDGYPGRTILLSAGRLAPEKQVKQLLPVMQALRDEAVHLCIVGDGPERSQLEQIFSGYPVTFTGYLSGDALSAAFASSDLFCFPSSSIETFGLVVAEAMASGTPVVASDVGGVREIIQDGENGFIVPESDTAAFTRCVCRLALDDSLRSGFSARAVAATANRTWDVIMAELFDVYHKLATEGVVSSSSRVAKR